MKSPEASLEPAAPRGRPRGFCVEQALDRALQLFWEKGYEGASLSDLTEAMGINRPSLYAAYGNKEELFRKALDRYAEGSANFLRKSLDLRPVRTAVEQLLVAMVDGATCAENPHGCLMVRCTLSGGEAAQSVRLELAKRRANVETLLRERLEIAQAEGDLPPDASAGDLARFLMIVYQGISVQAAGGASREELRRVAETAMKAWPA